MRVWALVCAKLLITQFVRTVCANTPIILFNYNRVLFRAISDTTQVKRLTFLGSGAFDIAFAIVPNKIRWTFFRADHKCINRLR